MPIITISRGTFSGGKQLAEELGKRLHYRSVSREVIVRAAAEAGVSEHKLRAAIEQSFSTREHSGMDMNSDRAHYLAFVQAALCEEARHDNIIYHGHGGHLLLNCYFVGGNLLYKGISHIIKVMIVAALEQRIVFAMKNNGLSRADAKAYILAMDEQKRKWARFLYKTDWDDLSQYDLVVDLQKTTLQEAGERICAMAGLQQFQATPASRQAMEDLLAACRKNRHLHQSMLSGVASRRDLDSAGMLP